MDEQRKSWNKRQKKLRTVLLGTDPTSDAIELFFEQHAAPHSSRMSGEGGWSFEDQILDNLGENGYRCIPSNYQHSIAWLVWHITRIEDVAIGMLVGGSSQRFDEGDWSKRLGVKYFHTGNAMSADEIKDLSSTIHLDSLRAYRVEVGRRTRSIVKQLDLEELSKSVDPKRLQIVSDLGIVVEAAQGVIEYWGKRTIAGLLLMPATRHNLIHLNEAAKIKSRLNRNEG